jgi:ABC-type nitrate/sulfonate/bicarbonate transport system substrate-binding protein
VVSQVLSCGGASNASFQNVTTTLDPVAALKSKQFDFAWVYQGWEVIEAQREGVQLNVFPLRAYCMPDYSSPVIITSQQMIQQHPAEIKAFLRATSQGYTYAVQHPHDAAALLIAGAPAGTFDDSGLVYASQAYLSPQYMADVKCWGEQSLEKWTDYPRFMFDHGALQDANGNPIRTEPAYAAAYTNTFLPC